MWPVHTWFLPVLAVLAMGRVVKDKGGFGRAGLGAVNVLGSPGNITGRAGLLDLASNYPHAGSGQSLQVTAVFAEGDPTWEQLFLF